MQGGRWLATRAWSVVPTGMPLRGPDMSVDMRPGAVSEEIAGPDGSDPLAVGLVGPLGLCGAVNTAAYVAPPSGDPSCRPPVAACSPVALVDDTGSGAYPSPVVGRRFAGSEVSPELASSLALRFSATLVVLRLPARTVGLFFFFALVFAFLNSFTRAGEGRALEIALRKASPSCLNMTLWQALQYRL